MNKKETAKILSQITVAYPTFENGRKMAETVDLWQRIFSDETFTDVESALIQFIENDTRGFAPVIGNIKEILNVRRSARFVD